MFKTFRELCGMGVDLNHVNPYQKIKVFAFYVPLRWDNYNILSVEKEKSGRIKQQIRHVLFQSNLSSDAFI